MVYVLFDLTSAFFSNFSRLPFCSQELQTLSYTDLLTSAVPLPRLLFLWLVCIAHLAYSQYYLLKKGLLYPHSPFLKVYFFQE